MFDLQYPEEKPSKPFTQGESIVCWTPSSWRNKHTVQQPIYETQDQHSLSVVLAAIQSLGPLVSMSQVRLLDSKIRKAILGKGFLLQLGDCAEKFSQSTKKSVYARLNLYAKSAAFIGPDVTVIGRMAGQYGKPRSLALDPMGLPIFRGENIHSHQALLEARKAEPKRLLEAYFRSEWTIKEIKQWILETRVHMFISHEGIFLPYEESLTQTYNLGAHTLWLGDRSRDLNGGHVEYFRGILNPIGVKIGPKSEPEEIFELIQRLSSCHSLSARTITLIPRFGVKNIEKKWPPILKLLKKQFPHQLLFSLDPMHGNTYVDSRTGLKTRHFDDIKKEIALALKIHQAHGTRLSGLHLEVAESFVTECLGGIKNPITPSNLNDRYESLCDPRLNPVQLLELLEWFFLLREKGHML